MHLEIISTCLQPTPTILTEHATILIAFRSANTNFNRNTVNIAREKGRVKLIHQ